MSVVRRRNPLLILALCIVTLGIYAFFWFYAVNRELARVSLRSWPVGARVRDLAILVCAAWLFVLAALGLDDAVFLMLAAIVGVAAGVALVIIEFQTCEAVERAQRRKRIEPRSTVAMFLVLLLLPLIGLPWVQSEINRVADGP